MRESSGRTTSSKRPVSSCSSSSTSAWKRRPRLSTSTMSPAPMPLEVVRRDDDAVEGSAGSKLDWRSAMGTAKLRGGADGLPHAAVELHVLVAVGADADDRRAVGGQGTPQRRTEGLDVGRALPAAAVQGRGVREVEAVRRGDVLDKRVAL